MTSSSSTYHNEEFTGPQGRDTEDAPPDLRDPEVFKVIWHQQQPHLYFLALRMLGDRQAAQDAATEAFIKLWKSNRSFPNDRAVISWLRVTTRNGCLDLLRQRNSREQLSGPVTGVVNDAGVEWEADDILASRLQALYTQINALPPRGQEIFRLRFFGGLKNEVIAERLGLTHQTVRDHLSKSLKTLRLSLKHRKDLLLLLAIFWQGPPPN